MWIVGGVCLAGAVHDFISLWASIRRGGRSLAEIARTEIGPVAGTTGAIAILFIVVIALAGLGLAVVNALAESAWGTFTIGMTIPLAMLMGFYMFKWRKGHIQEATIIGVIAHAALRRPRQAGRRLRRSRSWFLLSRHQLTVRARRLRLRRVGAAGLDAADAARLPQHVHEDRHDRAS